MTKARASLWMMAAALAAAAGMLMTPYSPSVGVQTAVVARGDLLKTRLCSGVVSYAQQQPLVSLRAGRVQQVHVTAGQQVERGELLISMDVSREAQLLASMIRLRTQHPLALAAAGSEWLEKETELRMQLEAAQIRAEMNGIVHAVFVQDGDWVQPESMLGMVRGEEKCVTAMAQPSELAGITQGAAAALEGGGQTIPAVLARLNAPEETAQQLVFQPSGTLEMKAGEHVTVSLLHGCLEDVALVPLAAVNRRGEVWIVNDGKALPVKLEADEYNESYAAAPAELAGCRVILLPDRYELTDGCRVREARAE